MGGRRRAAHHNAFLECWRAGCECRVCTETVAWRVDAKGVCGSRRRVRKSLHVSLNGSGRSGLLSCAEVFGTFSLNGSGRSGLLSCGPFSQRFRPVRAVELFGCRDSLNGSGRPGLMSCLGGAYDALNGSGRPGLMSCSGGHSFWNPTVCPHHWSRNVNMDPLGLSNMDPLDS